MYGLSEQDRQIQARAREFADELIPFEDEAERSGGQLPADLIAAHAKRARELGLHSTNMPKELGGGGCSALQQVLVQEQMGRVTNALGWVAATPPSWLPAVATADQIERYVRPAINGEREECYAITEEGAGSDVDGIEATAILARRPLYFRESSEGSGEPWLAPTDGGSRPARPMIRGTADESGLVVPRMSCSAARACGRSG